MQNSEVRQTDTNRMLPVLVLVLVAVFAAGVGCRAAADQRKLRTAEQHFFFSSDYLAAEAAAHTVLSQDDLVEVRLFNYEKENTASCCGADIAYTVTVSDGWQLAVVSRTGEPMQPDPNACYIMAQTDVPTWHTLQLTRTDPLQTTVEITVQTTAPAAKTLQGSFSLKE